MRLRLRDAKRIIGEKWNIQAKRKLLSGILNCADAAIEKTEQLAADVRQYQTDKAERETGSIGNMEAVNSVELAVVAEPGFQYGAEAFEAYQKEAEKAMTKDNTTKNMPVKSGKSRQRSPLELNLGLIQGDFFFCWSFSAKTGHFLQGIL